MLPNQLAPLNFSPKKKTQRASQKQLRQMFIFFISLSDSELFVSFRFVSFRFVSFRFVSFRFVSFRFVSFRFVSSIIISYTLANGNLRIALTFIKEFNFQKSNKMMTT